MRSENTNSTSNTVTSDGDVAREGGLSGWLHSLFGDDPHEDESHFAEAVRRGHAVVSVNASSESEAEMAARILNEGGAIDIDKHVDTWRQSGYAVAPAATTAMGAGANASAPLPVIQEELQVGKRVVNTGGVRVYSKVIDVPVEEQINLREERVRVERRPVDREVTSEDLGRLRDQTIEVTQMSEEAVVSKRARVVEEVVVGKDATERTETIRDNVRRTEVKVDELTDKSTTVKPR